jgi:hypothetical protein
MVAVVCRDCRYHRELPAAQGFFLEVFSCTPKKNVRTFTFAGGALWRDRQFSLTSAGGTKDSPYEPESSEKFGGNPAEEARKTAR